MSNSFEWDFNRKGHQVVANTTAVTGNFYGFTALAATAVNEVSYATGYDATADDLGTVPVGVTVYAPIRSIKLTSGTILLLKE